MAPRRIAARVAQASVQGDEEPVLACGRSYDIGIGLAAEPSSSTVSTSRPSSGPRVLMRLSMFSSSLNFNPEMAPAEAVLRARDGPHRRGQLVPTWPGARGIR